MPVLGFDAHLGAGKTLQDEIDPSVIDENDPISCDPELDIYRLKNGFTEPPQSSEYSKEFLLAFLLEYLKDFLLAFLLEYLKEFLLV